MDPNIELDIKNRTPAGWDGLSTSFGWDNLVAECHMALKAIDPGYEVHQIKQKFGGLRYYCSLNWDNVEANKIIKRAEDASYVTCEKCGSTDNVSSESPGYWISTLCAFCRAEALEAIED